MQANQSNNQQVTDDLSFAAYCHVHGNHITKMEENKQSNRIRQYRFFFNCSNEEWENLKIEFINSPEARFDLTIKSIKKSFKNKSRLS